MLAFVRILSKKGTNNLKTLLCLHLCWFYLCVLCMYKLGRTCTSSISDVSLCLTSLSNGRRHQLIANILEKFYWLWTLGHCDCSRNLMLDMISQWAFKIKGVSIKCESQSYLHVHRRIPQSLATAYSVANIENSSIQLHAIGEQYVAVGCIYSFIHSCFPKLHWRL